MPLYTQYINSIKRFHNLFYGIFVNSESIAVHIRQPIYIAIYGKRGYA